MSTQNSSYTEEYLKFMESSERTGLLYEMALGLFNRGQVVLSDSQNDKTIVPIVTEENWLHTEDIELNISTNTIENIDAFWMDRVFERLDYQNAGEIWNGDVCQVKEISGGEIQMNESNYFTLASHREKYISEVADLVYRSDIDHNNQQQRDTSQLKNKVYSLMGITYTTIVDAPSSDSRYLLYGKRASDMNELASFRMTAPAGIVQPRHIQEGTFEDTIRRHFAEEFSEEVLHEVVEEEQFLKHMEGDNIEYEALGVGIDPLRYSTEVAAHVYISGELAEFVLKNMAHNNEMEELKIYDIDSVNSSYNPLFARGMTPQSLFTLSLYLSKYHNNWGFSINE